MTSAQVGETSIEVVQGDLTQQPVDAIVNAANELLQHGGGVAAAIARAGGESIQRESDQWVKRRGPVPTGSAAVTGGGELTAQYVVHTVGPRYQVGQDNESWLRAAVRAALGAAQAAGASSVALPAISAGVFGYPREEATAVIASEVVRWSREHTDGIGEVRLVGFDQEICELFAAGLEAATSGVSQK